MKKQIAIATMALLATSLFAGDKDDVKTAVKKLTDSGYSWKTSTQNAGGGGGGGGRGGGATEGKFAKDGTILISTTFGDRTMETAVRGEKVVSKTPDGWKTPDEMAQAGGGGGGGQGGGRGRGMMGRMFANYKHPALQAESILSKVQDLKQTDNVYTGDLTEEGAKELLTMGRGGRAGGQAPAPPKDAKGSVKFWLKDGALTKLEYTVQGKMTGRNDNEIDVNRTTTVEFKDAGATKVELPEEASKKL
jgi:hypothetical protein